VNEMASAAGLPCDIDPALCAALRSQKTGELLSLFLLLSLHYYLTLAGRSMFLSSE